MVLTGPECCERARVDGSFVQLPDGADGKAIGSVYILSIGLYNTKISLGGHFHYESVINDTFF